MGMGDCTDSVIPKFGLVAPPTKGGSLSVCYFMPWKTHPTLAVTGAQCLSACALTPGTVADGLSHAPMCSPAVLTLEHPMGAMDVVVDYKPTQVGVEIQSAGLFRTARKLADGVVFVPSTIWNGP